MTYMMGSTASIGNEESRLLSAGSRREINVLVTGFGEFRSIKVNPSFLIVSSLPPTIPLSPPTSDTIIRLHVHPTPVQVAYSSVSKLVPELSAEYPDVDIVLHLGVAELRKYFAIERGARRDGYVKLDVDGKTPSAADTSSWVRERYPEFLRPDVDIDDVWRRWLSVTPDADLRPSPDAGDYLCGFLLYSSLAHAWAQGAREDNTGGKRFFLHVPGGTEKEDIEKGRTVTMNLIRALAASLALEGKKSNGDAGEP
ncbi:MAG: hypothetical protein M1819_004882 [Sarea resinae]|nr:MAG: hypothetical protein M1819_004882 [Sarea resinae]